MTDCAIDEFRPLVRGWLRVYYALRRHQSPDLNRYLVDILSSVTRFRWEVRA